MKKIYLLALILIGFQTVASAQKTKVTVDDDTIKVNEVPYAIMDKSPGLGFDFKIKNLEGKDLFFMKFLDFYNPSRITSGNPKGRVTYFEVTFLNDGKKCEVSSATKKGVAKMIIENDLIKENQVNTDAENTFVLINGMKFSEERNNMNNGNVIIIQR
jgi:hypothetical protein